MTDLAEKKISVEQFQSEGYIRRLNMETIETQLGPKLVCNVYLKRKGGIETDLHLLTENPRLEAALYAAYASTFTGGSTVPAVQVKYERNGDNNILKAVDLKGLDLLETERFFLPLTAYDRAAALAYARTHWSTVSTDQYIGVKQAPGYRAVPSGTIFVRKTANDPATEVARLPNNTEIPLADLEDCSHFVSCCIGSPPNGTGGGLPIGSDYNTSYGRISARRLLQDLKDRNLISIVDRERMTNAEARGHLVAGALGEADLIFYYFNKNNVPQREPGHVGLYFNDATKQIACHTYCRSDQNSDYPNEWDSVNGAYAYTLAKVR